MALPVDELLLRAERSTLRALSAAAPRPRPEVQRRLRQVTAQLLAIELARPLTAVPEHPETESHRLAWHQR